MGCAASFVGACNLHNPGISPPEGQITYPAALSLSREANAAGAPLFLYLANSNFDISFNAGSVHSYNLERIATVIGRDQCQDLSLCDANGQCAPLPPVDAGSIVVPDDTLFPEGGAPGAGLDGGNAGSDAGLDAGNAADAGPLDGGGDAGLLDGGGDAGPLGASDAGALDAGADAGQGEFVLPGDFNAPSVYGTLRGILCDGRDATDTPLGNPTVCCYAREKVTDEGMRVNEVITDSYATGIGLAPDGRRLYVPLRSQNRLLFLDVNEAGELSCGDETGRCERGPTPKSADDALDQRFAPQATAVVVGTVNQLGLPGKRTFIATVHDEGQLSFFVERSGRPVLQDVFDFDRGGTPLRYTSVSLHRGTPGATPTPEEQLFYATASNSPFIDRVGVRLRDDGQGPRELLYGASQVFLTGVTNSTDIRAVETDPRDPSRLFAMVRGELESVVFLELDPTAAGEARVLDEVRLGQGPSKMVQARLGGTTNPLDVLFVSGYDSRVVFVVDVERRALLTTIFGFSGPFDMAVDPVRQFLYVADFRASVLRVVDISGIADRTQPPPRIIATIGSPTFAEGLE